jgi:hypothetical protein
MTFKVFLIKAETKDKNRSNIERDLNAFEEELHKQNMKITHMLTTPLYNVMTLLIIHYEPKLKRKL